MLKRVSIQNFKSLKDVTLDLQRVNLLIGPNNSGKSNFLKALEFFESREFRSYDLAELERVSYKHQRNSIKYAFDFKSKIKSSLEGQINSQPETFYRLLFDKQIVIENFEAQVVHKAVPAIIDENGNTISVEDSIIDRIEPEFRNYLSPKIYKPDPNKLNKPGPVGTGEEVVNADASNLVGFLDLMLVKYRRTAFQQIENDLQKCIPEFDEIKLDDVKPAEEIRRLYAEDGNKYSFRRLGLRDGRQDITYWADELSEGTLYFLALLCIINQPNPPKLLLLEEPEKGIHPRRIKEVIQFILLLVEEKDIQVIMTTHSPVVLDMFADMPESVFIFDKDEEGATHVKNLQRDVIEPDTAKSTELGLEPPHYTDALGDSWTVGFLGGVPK
ncbi:AAA family ATPase [Nibrella saemangeumensis]|uniref:AAA family ATPase n=1 Tax=Nibrella saemangeumensis TaxID=1084526 RepID=A0ABP8MKK7_9BACT